MTPEELAAIVRRDTALVSALPRMPELELNNPLHEPSLDDLAVAAFHDRRALLLEVERLTAALVAAKEVIQTAALETYTPEGAEVVAGQLIRQQQELRAAEARVAASEGEVHGYCVCDGNLRARDCGVEAHRDAARALDGWGSL